MSVLGTVAGSGAATATIGGTPMAASSGVAMAEPPLPNIPPRKPTPAPTAMIANHCTGPVDAPLLPYVQDLSSRCSIGCVDGSAAAALRPGRRRRGHVHRRRDGV